MRIAILSAHSCPMGNLGARDTGGMSVYIREVARELGKRGTVVDIFTRMHDRDEAAITDLSEGVRLIHLPAGDIDIPKLAVYSYLPDFTCNVERFRRREGWRYDLVFSHYWLSGWAGEYLRRWWNVPHVTLFHTLGAVKNAIGIGEDETELRLESERELAAGCPFILATTAKEKADLARYYGAAPEKISVIPCGVDLALFRPVDKAAARRRLDLNGQPVVLFVGRIEPLKGIDNLVRAMPCLPETKLLVVGGGEQSEPEIRQLEDLCRELGISGSVTFRGIIDHREMPYFYAAADVCVVPSYYESFSLVALESLACGTPIVANNVGNVRELVQPGRNGFVVANNSPASIAGEIALLFHSPRDRQAIRRTVAGYGWGEIARRLAGYFEQIVNKEG